MCNIVSGAGEGEVVSKKVGKGRARMSGQEELQRHIRRCYITLTVNVSTCSSIKKVRVSLPPPLSAHASRMREKSPIFVKPKLSITPIIAISSLEITLKIDPHCRRLGRSQTDSPRPFWTLERLLSSHSH